MKKDERHYRNVATLPCAQCGIQKYSQAAHSNLAEHGKARGMKADWTKVFPLCCTRPGEIGCHVRHDQYIGITREEAAARTHRYLAWTEHIMRALGLWPEDTSPMEKVSKVGAPIKKKVTPLAARNPEPKNEKSRDQFRASRGFPSKKTAISNVKSKAIVPAKSNKENAPKAPRAVKATIKSASNWPKRKMESGSKFGKGQKLQSRPFGSR